MGNRLWIDRISKSSPHKKDSIESLVTPHDVASLITRSSMMKCVMKQVPAYVVDVEFCLLFTLF